MANSIDAWYRAADAAAGDVDDPAQNSKNTAHINALLEGSGARPVPERADAAVAALSTTITTRAGVEIPNPDDTPDPEIVQHNAEFFDKNLGIPGIKPQ